MSKIRWFVFGGLIKIAVPSSSPTCSASRGCALAISTARRISPSVGGG
jgi:hypothetical protein